MIKKVEREDENSNEGDTRHNTALRRQGYEQRYSRVIRRRHRALGEKAGGGTHIYRRARRHHENIALFSPPLLC